MAMPSLETVRETRLRGDELKRARAFAVAERPLWQAWLAAHGVVTEGRTHWPRGSESGYFRHPDGHLLELATPGPWPIW